MVMAVAEKPFSETLTQFRKSRGWERSILAEKAGLSYQTILRYEKGSTHPERDAVVKIARALGMLTLQPLLEAAGYEPESPDSPELAGLSAEELQHIANFRRAGPVERAVLLRMGQTFAERDEQGPAPS